MSRLLLAIDTSTTAGSVAVGDGTRVLAEVTLGVAGQHSTALMPAIDAAVGWAGTTREQLGGVVVGGGPGSFTGLRIGAATAKGIIAALELPLWSYSGLLAAAAGCVALGEEWGPPVCAIFDARRRDVYAAIYRFRGGEGGLEIETITAPAAGPLEEVLGEVEARRAPTLFTGDAALRYPEEIRRLAGATIAPPHLTLNRASSLLWLATAVPKLGAVPEPSTWEPEYLRASGAERIAAAREAP